MIAAVSEELCKKGNIPNRVAMTRMPPSRKLLREGATNREKKGKRGEIFALNRHS
jgi:hypothetical protein